MMQAIKTANEMYGKKNTQKQTNNEMSKISEI